jgi:hypothetical protein
MLRAAPMIRLIRPSSIAAAVALAFVHAEPARAEAHCIGPIRDGDVWNLVCVADDSHESEDDYACDYFLSVTDSEGMTTQPEATGAVSPGQDDAVIWSSAVLGDDAAIVSASIVSGSCSR